MLVVNGTTIPRLYYNCIHHGHLSYNFPHPDRRINNQDSGRNGVILVNVGILLTQSNKYL